MIWASLESGFAPGNSAFALNDRHFATEVLGISGEERENLRYSKCCISWTGSKEFT